MNNIKRLIVGTVTSFAQFIGLLLLVPAFCFAIVGAILQFVSGLFLGLSDRVFDYEETLEERLVWLLKK